MCAMCPPDHKVGLDHLDVVSSDPMALVYLLCELLTDAVTPVYSNPATGTVMVEIEGMGVEVKRSSTTSTIGLVTNDLDAFKAELDRRGIKVDEWNKEKNIVWFTVHDVKIHCLERKDKKGDILYVGGMPEVDLDTGLED